MTRPSTVQHAHAGMRTGDNRQNLSTLAIPYSRGGKPTHGIHIILAQGIFCHGPRLRNQTGGCYIVFMCHALSWLGKAKDQKSDPSNEHYWAPTQLPRNICAVYIRPRSRNTTRSPVTSRVVLPFISAGMSTLRKFVWKRM